MATGGTLYDRLGVPPTATPAAIRTAFRTKARQLHPDVAEELSDDMAAVNEAWAILSDPVRREAYDALLRAGADDKTSTSSADPGFSRPGVYGADLLGALIAFSVAILVIVLAVVFIYAFSRSGAAPAG